MYERDAQITDQKDIGTEIIKDGNSGQNSAVFFRDLILSITEQQYTRSGHNNRYIVREQMMHYKFITQKLHHYLASTSITALSSRS
jgi:hypothetical protein